MSAFNFSTCSGLTRAEKVTLPDGLRPAPLRFPPREYKTTFRGSPSRKFLLLTLAIFVFILEFPAQQASRASGMVADFVGVGKASALRIDGFQAEHVFDKMLWGFDSRERNGSAEVAAARPGVSDPLRPCPDHVWRVKNCKSDWKFVGADGVPPLAALDNGSHYDLVSFVAVAHSSPKTGMNFSGENSMRQIALEPFRRLDDSAIAVEKLAGFRAVPPTKAAIELLAGIPADEAGLPNPVNAVANHIVIHDLKDSKTIKRSQA